MEFCALASGSSGNSIYVGNEDTRILVDAGLTGKKTIAALESIGIDPCTISAILITHDHSDHIAGAAVLARKLNVRLFGTAGTLDYIVKRSAAEIPGQLLCPVRADESFTVGSIDVSPFRISHDAIDPVAYCLSAGGRKLGMATDLGEYNDYIVERLSGCDSLYIESNHDYNMLMAGPYPYVLKSRIHSPLGHLSNDDTAKLVNMLQCERLRRIMLAHLSEENNFEELAYETVSCELKKGWKSGELPKLYVAKRYVPSEFIKF